MLYAEHLGYVTAKPSDWPSDGPQSRAEMHLRRTGRRVPMPPVPVGGYLVRAFHELGLYTPLGDGSMVAVSFSEIVAAFPWANERERATLKSMSRAFLRGWRTGSDALGIPPWEPENS